MSKKDFYVKDSQLDNFQVMIINNRNDKSFIVQGCAGSGKSILAMWKAKHIQNQELGSYQIIVYTKTLQKFMLDSAKHIGIDETRIVYHSQWKKLGSPVSDYIIVDEAQDFNMNHILEFKQRATKAVFYYGDSAQQLYKDKDGLPTVKMEDIYTETRFNLYQLQFNHRLPKEIARVANYINSESEDAFENRCINTGSEIPKILRFNSINEQLEYIIEIIINRNFIDVGILFSTNNEVKYAYNYLSEKGFNVEVKYDDNQNYQNNKMSLNFDNENPKLMTYHSSKGLQFEAVFLPECKVSDNFYRNALYVAITRTYQSLYIMHSGNLSRFFDLVPLKLYDTSLIMEIEKL